MQTDIGRVTCKRVAIAALVGVFAAADLAAQDPKALEPKDGLECLLVNKHSGRCLSVANGSVENNAKIVQGPFPKTSGAAEHWKLLGAGKAFRLRNEKSGLVVQVWSSNRQPGVQAVQSADLVTKEHQHWTFEPIQNAYLLRAGHSQLVLGIPSGALEEGARVIQWTYLPEKQDQLWLVRSTTDDADSAPSDDPKTPAASPQPHGWLALAVLAGLVLLLVLAAAVGAWGFMRRKE